MEILHNFFHALKPYVIVLITFFASLCNPIKEVLWVLSVTFVFNIFTGIVTDANVNKAHFSITKAFNAIFQMAFLMALVYYVHGVFDSMGMDAYGHIGIKWISIIAVYFYTTNILRNVKLVFPNNKAFSFLYEIMTTQILSRIRDFFLLNKNEKNGI